MFETERLLAIILGSETLDLVSFDVLCSSAPKTKGPSEMPWVEWTVKPAGAARGGVDRSTGLIDWVKESHPGLESREMG